MIAGLKPPVMDLSLYSEMVTVRVGQRLHLRIPYTGNPQPEFAWLFNKAALLGHMTVSQGKIINNYTSFKDLKTLEV